MHEHRGPVKRLVAIGDLHGDLGKAKMCAQLAGIAGPDGSWLGSGAGYGYGSGSDPPANTVVVQLGDQIDGAPRLETSRRPSAGPGGRHDCAEAVAGDLRVMAYFDELDRQAVAAGRGCRVYSLLGNHEMDNAAGGVDYADVCPECRATRAAYFRAGGDVARHMAATRHACVVAGGVLFSHAGVLPRHLPYLGRAGEDAAAYLRGEASPGQLRALHEGVTGPDGFMRHRAFAPDRGAEKLKLSPDVDRVLAATRCNAMVLGHNAHRKGVSALHGGRVWVVDPGMSASLFGADPTVLEISVGASGDLSVRTVSSRKSPGGTRSPGGMRSPGGIAGNLSGAGAWGWGWSGAGVGTGAEAWGGAGGWQGAAGGWQGAGAGGDRVDELGYQRFAGSWGERPGEYSLFA